MQQVSCWQCIPTQGRDIVHAVRSNDFQRFFGLEKLHFVSGFYRRCCWRQHRFGELRCGVHCRTGTVQKDWIVHKLQRGIFRSAGLLHVR